MSGLRPPRWLERLVELAVPKGLSGEGTLGDLAEGFERRARESAGRARVWYAGQTVSVVVYRMFTGSGTESSRSSSSLLMDLRWSMRSILRHPGFALGVITILGLGLGANAAVFSVVDGTLRNTSWWTEPDRTVSIWPEEGFSFGQLELYQDEQAVYRSLGGYNELAFAVRTSAGESESVNGVLITPELFRELSVQPTLGRALSDDDAMFGAEPVVVIADALWRRSFGADPAVVGGRIELSGAPVTVVGIQAPDATAPGGRAELWVPLVMDPRDDDFWKAQANTLVGVLRDGADLDDAFADLTVLTDRLSALFPMFYPEGWASGRANVIRADEAQRRLIETPLLLLLAGTVLLMLVTALNVGNLLLGRAISRRKELAVRASLGAGRGRIVGQLLVEGLVLTALALGVGLGTGAFGGRWVAKLFVEQAVVVSSSVLSPSVLAFALCASALAWIVLNGVPVAHFLRSQRYGLTVSPDSGKQVQRTLVTVQAALATLLLVSAALLVGTVDNLRRVPLGFEPNGLFTVELSPPQDRIESIPAARDLYDRLAGRVGAIPGVESVGLTGWLPLREQAPSTPINLRSAPVDPREAVHAPMQMVDPGFFESLGIEASSGRLLGSADRALDAPSAVVVNETLASLLWPDGSAVGQLIAIDPHAWNSWAPVVGVIPDIRSGEITGPIGPALYVSLAESPARDVTLVVRTATISPSLISMIRRTLKEVDPLVPIRGVATMDDVVRAAYATAWVMMGLLGVLAVLATALGSIGIYAVLAHHVALNKREIGVRMALGAQPGTVVTGVVRSGLVLAGIGIVIGSGVAAVSSRFLESLLFEVSTLAPMAFIAPAAALAAASALAAWVPAARAGRLPPAEVLKSE
jgi:predicted permease